MRELGINVEETAIMSAVTPVVAIFMPPLAGMIADKIGNFRVSIETRLTSQRSGQGTRSNNYIWRHNVDIKVLQLMLCAHFRCF